jgi:uncharacterized cupin superfamily protein
VVPEAELVDTEGGKVASGDGWFVVNAREAKWEHGEALGSATRLGEGERWFPEFGINVNVIHPGQPSCMYHGENAQEAFLVLDGEGILIVEGQERPLRKWDFFHCPPRTLHVLVGAGSGPFVFLAVGTRKEDEGLLYPVDEAARKYDACALEETSDPREAYGRFPRGGPGPYREGLD